MIICHCCRVNHEQLEKCISEGACTIKDIKRACKAATKCGGCKPAVIQHLLSVLSRDKR
jgi:NAD(P)H-nitrite reductase large subunit